VRYAQLFDTDPTIPVFCNRGTSGIDGSTSTAVGAAWYSNEQTVFISGDISFFYDSNGLWNRYIKNDFRIILINNGGGGIFRILPGPKASNVLEYFEYPHSLTAKQLAEMHGFSYCAVNSIVEIERELESFYESSDKPKLLEILTPSSLNDEVLKEYFKKL
jgi:2-succinyl-5-enolpyruvyl-6-hydroxy-3-cyclohexene-1-carboxylate synthase